MRHAGARTSEAIKLLLDLAREPDITIRRDAVRYGLSTVRDKSEEIVRALIEHALTDRLYADRVAWGLHAHPTAVKLLDEALRGDDPVRAEAAREVYRCIAQYVRDQQPEGASDLAGTFAPAFQSLHEHIGHLYPGFRAKGIDWAKVGRELEPRAARANTERDFGLLVEEIVARLEDSHAIVVAGTANPPQPDLPHWGPGLVCLIDERGLPVVYAVERGSPAEKAGITPGRAIVSVNGVPAEAAMRQWMDRTRTFYGYSSERTLKFDAARAFLAQLKRGDKLTLKTRDLDGREATVELSADRPLRGGTSWFVAKKRARLFGSTTAGASCRKEIYTLTNGLYRVVVPVKAYTGFLDRPIERRGIEPDVEVKCTAQDLTRGRDTVVEAAAAWLSRSTED
jgi:Tricorn protease C1 domain/PDZ domain